MFFPHWHYIIFIKRTRLHGSDWARSYLKEREVTKLDPLEHLAKFKDVYSTVGMPHGLIVQFEKPMVYPDIPVSSLGLAAITTQKLSIVFSL
ncbi:hypothetical protein RRG08_000662 [Elysia crispata]|uniref:Uncharacterized protein n=1 Tax=Elysia crispata TaxID=231223 RepID=A0AAE0Y8H2_9GAST|nr:hypothetical protein RRG08_000662 [Elysia crispata]